MNLNSVLRITARVTGIREFTKLDRAIKKTEKAARDAEKGFKKMLDSRLFRTAAVAAAGLTAAIALSTKAAIDFEASMAEVRKVVDGIDTPKAFAEISREILDLSSKMPIAAKGFAEIYAAAGRSGVAREELKQFATQVAQTAIAFDMTAEEAGTAMAKIMSSTGMTLDQLELFTDAIDHLGNNTASTEAQLVNFSKRALAVGASAGISAKDTAAIGAAMISAGAESEVAATSFRKVIQALSRGPSMTDRQIDALSRLGFAQSDAATNEKIYSEAVRTESEARINIARHETDELAKELNRRFRDQMTSIRDNMDDENEMFTERLQDQADSQIKALQRQQRAAIDAARERAEQTGKSGQQEIYAIQDAFDRRIDAVRDKLQDELKERRRADRDRLTQIQDDMNDRKELELAGLESNFNAMKEREKALMKERLDDIKAQAEAGAKQAAEALAKGLQQDAIGTITKVFDAIRELPQEAQLSVISDFFGDEARAIQPLIQNTELLQKSLALVSEESNFAGSKLESFLSVMGTTAAKIKISQNNIDALAIAFGGTFAPALEGLILALTPVINSFTWLIQNVPFLGPILGILSAAFIGLVAILPALGGLVTVLGAIGSKAAVFAGLGAALGVVKTAFLAIAGVLTGPLGIAALLGIAIGTVFAFREQIGQTISNMIEGIKISMQMLLEDLKRPFQMAFDWINENFIQVFPETINSLKERLGEIWSGLQDFLTSPIRAAMDTVKTIVNAVIAGIVTKLNFAIGLLNKVIRAANKIPRVNIPLIPKLNVPEFAEGGMVTGPTLGLVGEAGAEYIVPARKAQGFAENILAGVRGPAAIPRFAEGGFVAPTTASVNIQTGPVTQMDGQDFVTTSDMSRAVEAGVMQTLDIIRRDGSTRAALGLA